MADDIKKPDILDFLRSARSLKSQVEIIASLKLSVEEQELIEKSLTELSTALKDYLKEEG